MLGLSRPAFPCTITTLGRVAGSSTPGPADLLTGWHRCQEIWQRLRLTHGVIAAALLTLAALVYGVTLSGFPISREILWGAGS